MLIISLFKIVKEFLPIPQVATGGEAAHFPPSPLTGSKSAAM
jgi:hypothetical protein